LVPEEQTVENWKIKIGTKYKRINIQFHGFNTRSSEKLVKSNQTVNEAY